MQARSNYLRIVISTLICGVLLALMSGIVYYMQDNSVSADLTDQVFKSHRIEIQPVLIRYDPESASRVWNASADQRSTRFACQSNTHPRPALCYGPPQIRQAYHIPDLFTKRHITGKNSTIAIIDAYGSPNIRKDLHAFDTTWGLPDPKLHIIAPNGIQGSDSAWISETSLDVEWTHVMAPDATINLVLARDSDDDNIYKALAYAVKHNLGDIVSLSFGENENCVDPKLRQAEHRIFREATGKGMTLLAATGDFGATQMACNNGAFEKAISFPADDPLVTAVGGTTLVADALTGRYIRETTWNESSTYNKATGGGYSKIYRVPTFQRGLPGKAPGRAVPDISLNASVNGGVIVFESSPGSRGQPAINIMGGTSTAAPELAGLLADAVQMAHHRLGSLNPAIYKLGRGRDYSAVMHDITSGNNVLLSSGLKGYRAGPGWDAATGWGSPKNASLFLQALVAANKSLATPAPCSKLSTPPVQSIPVTPTTGTFTAADKKQASPSS